MSKSLRITGFRILGAVLGTALILLGCSRKPARSMALYDHIPSEVQKTTLLVEKFTHKDPVIYDSFYSINTDSLKQKFKFKSTLDEKVKPIDKPVQQKEHPLIVKTNKNLDSYNKKLEKVMKKYNYPYEIIDTAKLDSGKYNDLDKYRYVLYRKPVLHCFIDPEGVTRTSYRYTHYFHDRKTGQDFAPIEVFYPNPANSIKAIVQRINELATSQNEKEYRPKE
jgi:ribosomal protein L31